MNIVKILLTLLAIAFGIFLVIYGGWDDSPGAQGLGLLVAFGALYLFYRSRKKGE